MSPDFPIALRLEGKRVLVVGAGAIATGRVKQLVEVGARVHVIAPRISDELRALAFAGRIDLQLREFQPGDTEGFAVVFTATDDDAANRAVVEEARAAGILCNAADQPELCDFYVPAIGRRGPITIAISTAGHAPGLSRVLRDLALEAIGPEWAQLAKLVGRLRRAIPGGPARARALADVVSARAARQLQRGERKALWREIRARFEDVGGTR